MVASPVAKQVVSAGVERCPSPRGRGASATVSPSTGTWTTQTLPIGGVAMQVTRAGDGPPVLVLHHDIGTLRHLPFYDALARRFTVLVPSHPGYGGPPRAERRPSAPHRAAAPP